MKYSIEEKRNGELAARRLSEKMYAITGEGRDDEWLTLKEVESYFEEMYDELHESLEEDE